MQNVKTTTQTFVLIFLDLIDRW